MARKRRSTNCSCRLFEARHFRWRQNPPADDLHPRPANPTSQRPASPIFSASRWTGQEAVLPVDENVRHWFASPRSAVGVPAFMPHDLDSSAIACRRNLTMPGPFRAWLLKEIEAPARLWPARRPLSLIKRVSPTSVISSRSFRWLGGRIIRRNWRASELGFQARNQLRREIIQASISRIELRAKVA